MGQLQPEDVVIELVLGHANGNAEPQNQRALALEHLDGADGKHTFEGSHAMERSGSYAYGLRVRPEDGAARYRSAERPRSSGPELDGRKKGADHDADKAPWSAIEGAC